MKHIEAAMRLSPRDIAMGRFMSVLVIAHFTLGAYEDVLEWSTKTLNEGRHFALHVTAAARVAALAHLGHQEEALAACADLKADYTNIVQLISDFNIGCQDELIDGLKKAGLKGL